MKPERVGAILERYHVPKPTRETLDLEERRRAKSAVEAHAQAKAAFPEWLREAGVGREYRDLVYDESLIPAPLRAWAKTFPRGLRCHGGALICGSNGGGKTAAACWLIRKVYGSGEIIRDGMRARYRHPSARLVKAHEITRAIKQKRFDWTADLIKPSLLVIDNVGTAYEGFGETAAEMEWIADKRWEAHRPTVVTTTLYPSRPDTKEDTFQHRYPSLYDRTMDTAGVGLVSMNRDSLRRVAP